MKQFFATFLLCCITFVSFSTAIDGGVFHTSRTHITFDLNRSDYQRDWVISPDNNPDILRVFCENPIEVTFHLPTQDVRFIVSESDTIKLSFIVNSIDTANTLVVGTREIPNTIEVSEKLFHFSRLWSEAKYNYVNIDFIDFDLDSLYKSYLSQIMQSTNDYEYYRLLQRFFASLNDGHTEVFIPSYLSVYEDYIPITLNHFDKQLYITAIPKDIGLDSTLLAARILKINGIPIQLFLEDSIFPYISSSTEQSLWMQVPQAICYGLRSKPFIAEVEKTDGQIAIISLKRNGEATRIAGRKYYSLRKIYDSDWDFVKLRWHNDTILQLSINSFYPDDYIISLIKDKEKEIRTAKRLIIDLRGNGGGSTIVAHYIQSLLTNAPYFINYAWQTRINDGVRKANGNWIKEYEDYYLEKAYRNVEGDTIFIADTVMRWLMPTVILIGEYTFSAAEDFLVNIYEVPERPLLIGTKTGGSTGSPLVINELPSGGCARICTRRILFPYSHKPFVGEGIKPDIETVTTFEDYCSGIDKPLEKAIEILSK